MAQTKQLFTLVALPNKLTQKLGFEMFEMKCFG